MDMAGRDFVNSVGMRGAPPAGELAGLARGPTRLLGSVDSFMSMAGRAFAEEPLGAATDAG